MHTDSHINASQHTVTEGRKTQKYMSALLYIQKLHKEAHTHTHTQKEVGGGEAPFEVEQRGERLSGPKEGAPPFTQHSEATDRQTYTV